LHISIVVQLEVIILLLECCGSYGSTSKYAWLSLILLLVLCHHSETCTYFIEVLSNLTFLVVILHFKSTSDTSSILSNVYSTYVAVILYCSFLLFTWKSISIVWALTFSIRIILIFPIFSERLLLIITRSLLHQIIRSTYLIFVNAYDIIIGLWPTWYVLTCRVSNIIQTR